MSTLSTIGSTGPATAPKSDSATGSSKLGKDEFLKLLMAQLGNQDPTSPTDNQAFVAQLAQFANVEQLQGLNSSLDSMLMAQASSSQMQAAALVGKQVQYSSDSASLTQGTPVTLSATLDSSAANTTVTIQNGAGQTVRTMQLGPKSAGALQVGWDGLDDHGKPLPSGSYKVAITASDVRGKSVGVNQLATGRVTGVSFTNGYPELLVGGERIKLSNVMEIDQAA